MISSLPMHPLPSLRIDEAPGCFEIERDGFVDDSAIEALIAPLVPARTAACPQDLVLSSSEEDFAGWQIPVPTARRLVEVDVVPAVPMPPTTPPPGRRATPPHIRSQIHLMTHRNSAGWWLAGLSGIFTSLFVSAVLLTWGTPAPEISTVILEPARPMDISAPAAAPSAALPPDLTRATGPDR